MKNTRKNWFNRHPVFATVCMIVLIYALLDSIAGAVFIPENLHKFRTKHSYYHHGLLPNSGGITNWGQIYYYFHTNSLGFRDICKKDISLASGKRRILFLGDSHTEGVGVNYENTFAGRLQKMTDTGRVEILNGAAVSYSPKIHYLKCRYLIEEKGLDFDELYVFIDISDLNNEIAYETFEPKDNGGISDGLYHTYAFLKDHSLTCFVVHKLKENGRTRKLRNAMKEAGNADLELYTTFFSHFRNEDLLTDPDFHGVSRWLEDKRFRPWAEKGLTLGQENILKLSRLCKNYGIELTIAVHPWPDQVLSMKAENEYVRSWQSFAESNDIEFINLFPLFINSRNAMDVAARYYIRHDNHWNALGHEVVAKKLLAYINKDPE
ncbi:MAG: hypothetical protein PVF73_01955 [Bacteroidales bacterium]|jgi:lysophospholipase L1-like esterase